MHERHWPNHKTKYACKTIKKPSLSTNNHDNNHVYIRNRFIHSHMWHINSTLQQSKAYNPIVYIVETIIIIMIWNKVATHCVSFLWIHIVKAIHRRYKLLFYDLNNYVDQYYVTITILSHISIYFLNLIYTFHLSYNLLLWLNNTIN